MAVAPSRPALKGLDTAADPCRQALRGMDSAVAPSRPCFQRLSRRPTTASSSSDAPPTTWSGHRVRAPSLVPCSFPPFLPSSLLLLAPPGTPFSPLHYVGWTPRRSPPAAHGADTESAPLLGPCAPPRPLRLSMALAPLLGPCAPPPGLWPLLLSFIPPCLGAPPIGYVGCPP